MSSNRILWIDTLKFLGILFIVIGHLGPVSGKLYNFVFLFHVPLFFFVSGLFHRRSTSFISFLDKKTKSLIIPYYILSLVSCVVYFLRFPQTQKDYLDAISAIMFGVRNTTFYAEGLWFFPCLFIMSVFFEILLISTKRNLIITSLTVLIMYYCISVIPDRTPGSAPKIIFNIDSSVYYMIYYCAGYILSGIAINIHNMSKKIYYPLTAICLAIISKIYSDGTQQIYSLLTGYKLAAPTISLLITLAIIVSLSLLSVTLSSIPVTSSIGRKTLIICGTENISKGIILSIIAMFGISFKISTPLMAISFSLAVIALSCIISKYIFSRYKYF
ncbi:TPA: acyltransferase family protein [Escherichia coli]|nr:acyltransferase family protein [Escherichia coli]